MHHAHRMRLRSTESFCRHHVSLSGLCAHGTNHIRADGARQQTQTRFRQTEGHIVGSNQHIAHSCQSHAPSIAVTLHATHNGHGALIQSPQHVGQL